MCQTSIRHLKWSVFFQCGNQTVAAGRVKTEGPWPGHKKRTDEDPLLAEPLKVLCTKTGSDRDSAGGFVENFVGDVNWEMRIVVDCQGDCVAGAAVDFDQFAVAADSDAGEIGVLFQFVDDRVL